MRRALMFLPLAALLASGAASAENFYKWVDSKGVTHYGEAAPEEAQIDVLDVNSRRAREAEAPQANEGMVVLYSTRDCKECDAARSYLQSHNIRFREYDVEESARGKQDYRRLRARRVPIILVGDRRLDGFTPAGFEALQK